MALATLKKGILMETKGIIENLIHQFNNENLISLLRAKTRTFRLIEEKLTQLNDEQFSESSLFGEFKVNNDLMVVVTARVNKPLSERSGKKAQYTLGKKFLKDSQRYIAGFFIFYDDKGDFRFSLIYDIPLSTGKRDWSNFRRYTYFVSKDQTNKTFIKQFTEADFSSLDKIIDAFSVEKVTKQFYQEIANWYFWAMDKVEYPDDEEKDREKRNAKNLIRLITRIIFIWFMKEKELVPSTLFDKSFIDKIINYKDKTGSTYYKAILQNLFFATLNTKMKRDDKESRIFVEEAEKKGYLSDAHLQQGYYRYNRFIKDKNLFIEQFENVPFLNGGLFECLDKKIDGKEIRIDCFSDNPKNETKLKVPDEIFFLEKEIDVYLSKYLDKGKSKKVTGLLTILKRYNFTIDENTPVDQDVALDPELLGKVFENLLAAYVPETSETARKATGSYYTPREIVEYMVTESLIEYISSIIVPDSEESKRIIPDSEDSTIIHPNSEENNSEDTYPFYNPYKEVDLFYGKKGKLPHMHQGSVWYFVTFRLADSLPKEIVDQLEQERIKWLEKHKNNKDNLTREELKEYYRLFSERVEEWLAAGYGSCILREERVANILAQTLLHFNGVKYELDDWVIMPNHVHLLVKPKEGYSLSEVMHSIKSYSANKINELHNKKGDVWLHESYDHIVRNEDAFYAIKKYIRENPVKAKIELPKVCCSWKHSLRSQEASSTILRSREASATFRIREALAALFDYSNDENPFDEQTTLKLIEIIENIKILDPACGSGAFPMGVLHKLVLALHKLDPDNKIWKKKILERVPPEIKEETEKSFENKSVDYIRKLGLIENCIYGVDIQEIAIQISKLRFFISLLVEQNIDDTKPNRDIRALPNLETKFVAANTLIGLNRPAQMNLTAGDIETLEKELFKVREEIFYTNSRKEKYELQRKEKHLREKLKTALEQNGFPNDIAEKITSWDPFDQNTHSDWFDPEWMFGIKVTESSGFGKNINSGFDIVIGNPPYIQLQKSLSDKSKLKYADLYKDQNYKTFERTGDIYCLFYEKGIQLLKTNGLLCYITSNKWMRAGYGEKLREFFSKYNPKLLIDLGPGIFENATVDTNILLIQKTKNKNQLRAVTLQKNNSVNIDHQLKQNGVILEKLTKDAWFIGSNAEQQLKEKIERIGKPLKDWDVNIYYGIKTGLNQAFIITTEKRNEILANCSVAESSRFAGLTERERTEAIIKPILRGRDIKRYHYEWAGLWVIVIPAGWIKKVTQSSLIEEKAEKEVIKLLPSLMNHLLPYKVKAQKRDDQGDYWWELRQCAYYSEFEKEKVVWSDIATEPTFTLLKSGVFFNNTVYMITSKTTKYMTGLLNSKITRWIFPKIASDLGESGSRYFKIFVEKIPLPPITPENQQIVSQIEALVDKILAAKKENLQSDTKSLEDQIDIMVYKLYNLTYEEVKLVDTNIEQIINNKEYNKFEIK
uniref:site-specific DNA-methyltransferase (adenine-specific) n=1 Tax=Ignavibacterium album TaxID=591197 RepID=A0A7V2ZJ99_9BACT